MKLFISTLTLILLLNSSLFSQSNMVEGEVTGLWEISDSPFIIEGDVTVPLGGKLTIDPGVEILFSGPYMFEVNGRLDATGTVEDSIYFGMTDTTGFSSTSYEGWSGMVFLDASSNSQEHSLLDYVNIEYSASSALFCANSGILMQNSKIKNNKGCGLYLADATDIIIESTQVSDNLSGGIKMQSASLTISDFIIRDNNGVGVLVIGQAFNGFQPIFQNGIISNNISDSYGGGIYVGMDASATITGVSILSNSAIQGGGICCHMGSVELNNSNVSFNNAESGAGIFVNGWSSVSINNTLVADNYASISGGAFFVSNSNLNIDRSTVAYNTAGEASGGIEYSMIENRINTISNSILWENYPQEIKTVDAQPEIQFSDVMGGYEGFNVMNEDPLFVDVDNSDYQLQWGAYPQESGFKSPAIDNGDPLAEFDPDGTVADMGAFYFEQSMVTSMSEKNQNYELSIYPNPVQESFKLNSELDIVEVQILDISGHIVKSFSNSEIYSLMNISDLSPGIYMLYIYIENSEVVTEKLIKN